MSDTVRQLIVGGISVPVWAMVDISQRYEDIEAKARRRFLGGGGWQRTTYSGKIRTVITGSGIIPFGLSGIDYDSSFVLSCVAHRSIISASSDIEIPAARRTDAGSLPYGRALVGDKWIETGYDSIVSNTVALTPVSGASLYQVIWFPKITVHADSPVEDKPSHGPVYGWSIVAEEV